MNAVHEHTAACRVIKVKGVMDVIDMESFGLFANAQILKKNAACLLTVSDSLVTNEITNANERQNSFTKMIELALNTANKIT